MAFRHYHAQTLSWRWFHRTALRRGSALIFVLGFPTLWYFVALAAVLGIAVALFLKSTSNWRSNRDKPLSIMTEADAPRSPVTRNSNAKSHLTSGLPWHHDCLGSIREPCFGLRAPGV